MSIVINKITWPPSRKVIFTIAGIAGGVAALGFLKRYLFNYKIVVTLSFIVFRWYFGGSHHSRRISRLPDQNEGNFTTVLQL